MSDWGNTVLRERLGENCAERVIGGTHFGERGWWITVLRERLWEQTSEREIVGKMC